VHISGFSDSVLAFIAERGDGSQLGYVESIDVAKGLVDASASATHAPPGMGRARSDRGRQGALPVRPAIVWLGALLVGCSLGGCSFGGRFHLGDIWVQAGHGLALVSNHVAITLH
jgi:hypothetical protein